MIILMGRMIEMINLTVKVIILIDDLREAPTRPRPPQYARKSHSTTRQATPQLDGPFRNQGASIPWGSAWGLQRNAFGIQSGACGLENNTFGHVGECRLWAPEWRLWATEQRLVAVSEPTGAVSGLTGVVSEPTSAASEPQALFQSR